MTIPTHPLHELSPLHFNIERIDHINGYNPTSFHRHDYFEIFLFKEGGGVHHIDFFAVPVLPNSIHFVTPGQVHRLERANQSSGFVLLFSTDFFAVSPDSTDFLFQYPLFYNKTGNPTLTLPEEGFAHLLQYVESMLKEFANYSPQKKRILQSYLNIFLCRCQDWVEIQQVDPPEKTPLLDLFHQLQIAIEQNYASKHQVEEYAKILFVTARQLNNVAQKYAGKTLSQMIHERIVIEAKRLLRYSGSPIGVVAEQLGFEDIAHFSKFIKRHTGQAPSEWRGLVKIDK
jgi:AraC-like DNA-binding protein